MEQTARRAGRGAITLFAAGTFFYWASLYVYVPILPIYAKQMGASLTMVGLVVGAYGATQFLLRIPLGVGSDRLGKRKPFVVAGLLASALGALGLALAPDPWLLFLARALTGVAASSWVAFTVLFSSYFPPGHAVRAMSLITFVNGIAQVTSTYSGGWIAETFGWTAPFYVGAALAGLGLLCTRGMVDEPAAAGNHLTPRRVARIVTIPLLLAVSVNGILSQYAVFVTTYAFVPVYAEQLGATRADQGGLMTAVLLPYTLSMLAATWLTDRVGERMVVVGGMGLAALAVVVTPLITSLPVLAAVQVVTGIGRGLAFPVLMGLSIKAVPQSERATAMGVFQAVYAIGMFAGPVFGGGIADALGLPAVFYSTAFVCLASVALALATIPASRPAR